MKKRTQTILSTFRVNMLSAGALAAMTLVSSEGFATDSCLQSLSVNIDAARQSKVNGRRLIAFCQANNGNIIKAIKDLDSETVIDFSSMDLSSGNYDKFFNAGGLFENAKNINLSYTKPTQNLLSVLNPNLIKLDLSNNGLSDNDIAPLINRFSSLTTLDFNKLTTLELGNNKIGEASAFAIASSGNLTGLTLLGLGHNQLGTSGVSAILKSSKLTSIQTLQLKANNMIDNPLSVSAQARSRMKGLVSLDLSVEGTTPSGTTIYSFLGGTDLATSIASYYAESPLKRLALDGVAPDGIITLAKSGLSSSITELTLTHSQVINRAPKVIKNHFNGLEYLDLSGWNELNSFGAQFISQMTNLKQLYLGHTSIGVDGARSILTSSTLSKLTNLDLRSIKPSTTQKTGDSLFPKSTSTPPSNWSKLKTLVLSGDSLTDSDVSDMTLFFSGNNFDLINLSSNSITPVGAATIANARCMSSLTSLDLSDNHAVVAQCTDAIAGGGIAGGTSTGSRLTGVPALADKLLNLTSLTLQHNCLQDSDLNAIAFGKFTQLSDLNLENNSLIDSHILILLGGSNLYKLTSLDLARNMINYQGVGYIADSPKMMNLTSLNLSANQYKDSSGHRLSTIGKDCAHKIFNSSHLGNLTSLNLAQNSILSVSDTDIKTLSHLARLDLSCQIGLPLQVANFSTSSDIFFVMHGSGFNFSQNCN